MIIELTANEATVLHIILERIGGNQDATGHEHAYTLLRKLEHAGEMYSIEKEKFFPVCTRFGSIHFV